MYFIRSQNDDNYTLFRAISGHMRCQTTVVVLLVFSFSSATALIVRVVLSRGLNWRVLCEQEKKTAYFKFKTRDYRIADGTMTGQQKTMYIRVARCS